MSSPTVSIFQPGTVGAGDLQDQHVLGQPALLARNGRGDAQREALLAEQRIAAIAGSEGPDLTLSRKMNDVLVGSVAGPGNVLLPRLQGRAHGVHAGDEIAVTQHFEHPLADTGHHVHAGYDVG